MPPAPRSAPVFGFSPRIAVDCSSGAVFVAAGCVVLVFDSFHSQLLSEHRLFAYGRISCMTRSSNALVAAAGRNLCLYTDSARAQGSAAHTITFGSGRVIACAHSSNTIYPLAALLQRGDCRGAGVVVHVVASSVGLLSVAATVEGPKWPSAVGGSCSCACVVVDDQKDSYRFVCVVGALLCEG
jgi:hypothetical protein